jgi:hypothetical protein
MRHFQAEHILNHVVGERVSNEEPRVSSDCHRQRLLLVFVGCIDAFLHQAAPVLVTGNLLTLQFQNVKDKLFVRVRPRLKYFYQNMISVDFTAQFHNFWLQKFGDQLSVILLPRCGDVNQFLDTASAVHLLAKPEN